MDTDAGSLRGLIRDAYDSIASERAAKPRFEYREHFLFEFLDLLRAEGRTELVEFGAGAGQDAMVFHEGGINVLATDLAPEHVAECRRRGLEALVADFYDLPFPDGRWQAGLAMSSLIHVPNDEIDCVLTEVHRVMARGAPLGVGTWAGAGDEGEWTELDEPYRFFSIRSDAVIQEILGRHFTIEHFATVPVEKGTHYQWAVARVGSV